MRTNNMSVGTVQGMQATRKAKANKALLAVAAAAAVVGASTVVRADSITWDGGGTDDNWSSAANWGASTQFDSGDTLAFSGNTRLTPNNDTTGSSARINFTGATGSFVIGGNAITLTNSCTVDASTLLPQTINLDMSMSATRTFTLSGVGGNLTLGGTLSGAGGLTKGGTAAATLFLNGSNSFSGEFATTGVTSINTLTNAGSNSSIGTAATFHLGVAGSGSLFYTGGTTSTNRQVKIGHTTVSTGGTGTLLNNGSGAMTFTNGTFNVAPVAGVTAARTLALGGSSTATNEIQGVIQDNNTGGGGLISVSLGASSYAGGTWKLSGANTYTGVTTISYGGVLEANTLANGGSNSSIGKAGNAAANLVFGASGGTLRYTGTADASTNRAFTFSSNSFTAIDASGTGTLSFTDSSVALGTATGKTLTLTGSNTGNNTFGKILDSTAALTKSGAGKWVLTGANTYSGATTVSEGTLVVGSGGTLGGTGTTSAANIVMTGGNLDLGGTTKTLSGAGTVSISAGTGDIIANGTVSSFAGYTDTAATTLTVSANLQGAGGYNKNGIGGITTLTGTNTYAGTTSVNDGTLRINGSVSGNVTAPVGTIGGTGSIGGTLSVTGKLSPGASIESLSSGALTMNNGSTFEYEVNSSTVNADLQVVNGNLTLGSAVPVLGDVVNLTLTDLASTPTAFAAGTKFTLINYNGTWNGGLLTYGTALADDSTFTAGLNTWTIDYNATSGGTNYTGDQITGSFVNISIVPEPTSAAGLLGVGALAAIRRRRRS